MIFLFLFPLYLFAAGYMLWRFLYWLKNCHHVFDWLRFKTPLTVIFLALALSPIIAFILPKSAVAIVIRRISTYWIGIMLYSFIAIVCFDLLRLIAKKTGLKDTKLFSRAGVVSVGSFVALATAAVCLYGIFNARNIKTSNYDVTINKSCGNINNMKVVLTADLHIGYAIGEKHIKQTVNKINNENPDLVIIAGDIFDNSYDSMDNPDKIKEYFKSIKSRYGVYAVMGNHDVDEKILMGFTFNWTGKQKRDSRMKQFLEDCGIKVLEDETVLVDNKFYIAGRRDGEKPCTQDGKREDIDSLTKNLDKEKPLFVIAHEPDELQQTADAGADIDFSGHTHDGQLFPINIITEFRWENACGMIKKGNMYSIVTSGVGIFGPFMRVGTDAEICTVQVNFKG